MHCQSLHRPASTGSHSRHPLTEIGRAKHLSFAGTLPHPPPPSASLAPGSAAYKAQVDQVLGIQANLTDVQKIQARFNLHIACLHCSAQLQALKQRAEAQAEFFDVKTLSLGVSLIQNKAVLANYKPLHLVDLVRLNTQICSALSS